MAERKNVLVVALTRHLVLGWLLVPYWAKYKSDEIVEIEEVADFESFNLDECLSIEKDIIRLSYAYSEKNLMSAYSKEKTVSDFFRKMSDKQLKILIRPYIEKKQRVILELIRLHRIPLYLRDAGQKELFSHNRVSVLGNSVEVCFHVDVTEKSFRYSVSCRQGKLEMSLLGKTPLVLVTDPAYIIFDRQLYVFEKIEATRLIPFFSKSYVEVPDSLAVKYIESVILQAVERFTVNTSGLHIIEDLVTPRAELSIERVLNSYPALSLNFRYNARLFPPTRKPLAKYAYLKKDVEPMEIHTIWRNIMWEQKCVNTLLKLGLKRVGDKLFTLSEQAETHTLLDWINTNRHILTDDFIFTQLDTSVVYYIGDISMTRVVETSPDWFDIKIVVLIDSYSFPFIRFKRHIINGIREFVLPDDRVALLPSEWFTEYKEFFTLGSEKENGIRLKKAHYVLLERWWKNDLDRKDEIKKLLDTYEKYETVSIPRSIKATLRKYQQDGFSWMVHLAENNFGGCLADDMGLGKTVQTIALLQYEYQLPESPFPNLLEPTVYPVDRIGQMSLFQEESDQISPVAAPDHQDKVVKTASLIVMPTSLLHNWKQEIRKFSNLTVYEYSGSNRLRTKNIGNIFKHYNVILTTYGVLRNDIEFLKEYVFEYIILDESQYIKNTESIIYNTVMMLQGKHRLVLTGTPIENSLKDLWAQFNFINPGILGNAESFRTNFVVPITKEGNVRIEERLKHLIRPFFLRRTKKEVAPELPALTEKVLYCEMDPLQETIYKKEKNVLRNALLSFSNDKAFKNNSFIALQGMTRLRLLANHPAIVQPDYVGSSGKLNQILHYYETLMDRGHKVLIFSSFVKHLRILADTFDKRGWRYAMLTGKTQDREVEINRFSLDRDVSCFFISLKAGGVGLNLTEADYVFIIDPWWNPAAEMQAVGRAHRIGQDKQVIVYRFITSETIEEKIMKLQEEKSLLAETFITSNNPLSGLSSEDIEKLFG